MCGYMLFPIEAAQANATDDESISYGRVVPIVHEQLVARMLGCPVDAQADSIVAVIAGGCVVNATSELSNAYNACTLNPSAGQPAVPATCETARQVAAKGPRLCSAATYELMLHRLCCTIWCRQ
jgi:hypothetical protein